MDFPPPVVKHENSFSEHLITLLKKERFGKQTDRIIPKRRRLVDIQPGESVTAEHAAKIMIKKEKLVSADQETLEPKQKLGRSAQQ